MTGQARARRMRTTVAAIWAGLSALSWGHGAARAAGSDYISADLGQHLISIHSRFTGADVLLFGAKEGDGDVVVVLRGPAEDTVVRRKARTVGVWINRDRVWFSNVPGYYALAASRPLGDIGGDATYPVHEIGVENLPLRPRESIDTAEVQIFRDALIRSKRREGLYAPGEGSVTFIGERLFRTTFHFPANVPIGQYRAEVYLFNGGKVVSKLSTRLEVSKTGIEAALYSFANQQSLAYGLLAVVVALMAGWFAHLAFRKA